MTTPRHVRTAAARLAGSVEERTGAVSSFRVEGVEYARLDAGAVSFWLGEDERERRRVDVPAGNDASSGDGVSGTAVALDGVNGMQVNALLAVAHARVAPQAPHAALPADPGDLPASIGRPALRALHAAGLSTLEAMSTQRREAVGDLHGVGPRALRLLDEALATAGLDWV